MHCKSYSHFFSKKFQHICVSFDVNFNESLTNDIVSFEQLGPVVLNLSLNCANAYLKDMSQQVISLIHLGSTVVAQKGGRGWGGGGGGIQTSDAWENWQYLIP